MGLAIGRIEKEFIINNLIDKQLPVKIHGEKEEIKGTIVSFESEKILLKPEVPSITPDGSSVRAFFSYFGHTMTFETKLIKKDDESLHLQVPKGIYKNLQRKFERIPCPKDVKVSFTIADTKVELDFPKTEEYNPADTVEYSLTFDPDSIENLIRDFKQQAKFYAEENRIVMFREKKPETYEEQLIARLGKILYIPDTRGTIPEDKQVFEGRVISKDYIHSLEKTEEREDLFSSLEKIMIRRNNEGVHGFLYCPLVYHEYVVGYIALINSGSKNDPLEPEIVEYVYQFSRVLIFSLKKNGYFKGGRPVINTIEPEILDISASGLLFTSPEKRLKDLIMLYSDLSLSISLGPRRMTIGARVMRKFLDRNMLFFGMVFLDIKPEDFRFLFDFVYGRPFSERDEELWEGGAEPPKIEIT